MNLPLSRRETQKADPKAGFQKSIMHPLLADAEAFHVPAAVIGVSHLTIFEPASWWRGWWWLYVARTAICQCAPDQTAQNARCDSAGDDSAIMIPMAARRVAIRRRRRAASVIPIRTIVILSGCRLNAGENRATGDNTGKGREKNLFHCGLLHVSRTFLR